MEVDFLRPRPVVAVEEEEGVSLVEDFGTGNLLGFEDLSVKMG